MMKMIEMAAITVDRSTAPCDPNDVRPYSASEKETIVDATTEEEQQVTTVSGFLFMCRLRERGFDGELLLNLSNFVMSDIDFGNRLGMIDR